MNEEHRRAAAARLMAWRAAHPEKFGAAVRTGGAQAKIKRRLEKDLDPFPANSSLKKKLAWFQRIFLEKARKSPRGSKAEAEWLRLMFNATIKEEKEAPAMVAEGMYRDFLASQVSKREAARAKKLENLTKAGKEGVDGSSEARRDGEND